jgi:hypothetical protein
VIAKREHGPSGIGAFSFVFLGGMECECKRDGSRLEMSKTRSVEWRLNRHENVI